MRLLRHDVQDTILDVEMNCRGMVVLGDGYSKDWVATIDRKRAPLYAAYAIIRGVVVDRGHHEIDIRYRPKSVYVGATLTGVSVLAVCLIWLFFRRRAHDDVPGLDEASRYNGQ